MNLSRTKIDDKKSINSFIRTDDLERDRRSVLISSMSMISTLTGDSSFADSLDSSFADHSGSRMERIADREINKSCPTMPRRIDSVCGGPSETSTHTGSSEAQSRGAHSKKACSHDSMPACSHHSSTQVPVSSRLLRRGGSAFNVDMDPPMAPQRLASIDQPSNHTTRSALASLNSDMNQYRNSTAIDTVLLR
jgi:hypothetical protein